MIPVRDEMFLLRTRNGGGLNGLPIENPVHWDQGSIPNHLLRLKIEHPSILVTSDNRGWESISMQGVNSIKRSATDQLTLCPSRILLDDVMIGVGLGFPKGPELVLKLSFVGFGEFGDVVITSPKLAVYRVIMSVLLELVEGSTSSWKIGGEAKSHLASPLFQSPPFLIFWVVL
jgi:hypothetical protein